MLVCQLNVVTGDLGENIQSGSRKVNEVWLEISRDLFIYNGIMMTALIIYPRVIDWTSVQFVLVRYCLNLLFCRYCDLFIQLVKASLVYWK